MKAAGWMLVTAPTVEPLSVLSAREHLRVDTDEEDFLIVDYITTARMQCEELTSRAFLTQTWDAAFTGWPGAEGFILPRPPLASVTSIQYTTADGTVHTLSANVYQVITATEPGRVILAHDQQWPSETLDAGLPIVIRYVCGTAAATAWQAQAVRWLVGHMYENREAVIMGTAMPQKVPFSIQWLLTPYRVWY